MLRMDTIAEGPPPGNPIGALDPLAELTAREHEVLALMAQGLTDRGIGQRLWVTPKTVEAHVRSIFRKLRLPSTAIDNRRVHAVLTYLRAPDGPTPRSSDSPRRTERRGVSETRARAHVRVGR